MLGKISDLDSLQGRFHNRPPKRAPVGLNILIENEQTVWAGCTMNAFCKLNKFSLGALRNAHAAGSQSPTSMTA